MASLNLSNLASKCGARAKVRLLLIIMIQNDDGSYIFINMRVKCIFFQMFLLFLFITSNLIQFMASQDLDNDGNDIDNDQDLNINAFGNVITPIKGKKFIVYILVIVNHCHHCLCFVIL